MSRELYEMAWQYGEFKDSPDDDETMDWAAAELEAQLAAAQSRNNELEIICKALGSRVAAAKKMAEGAANE